MVEKKHIDYSVGEAWYLNSLEVNVNGQIALSQDSNRWVKGNYSVYFNAETGQV